MDIKTFGVVGAGQMGNGIAQVAAMSGLDVVMNDIKTELMRDEMTNEEIVIQGAKLQWKQLLGVGVVIDLDTIIQRAKEAEEEDI